MVPSELNTFAVPVTLSAAWVVTTGNPYSFPDVHFTWNPHYTQPELTRHSPSPLEGFSLGLSASHVLDCIAVFIYLDE